MKHRLQRDSLRCRVDFQYPQVTGLSNHTVERRLNRVLAAQYPPGGMAKYQREARSGDDTTNLEVTYRTTLNRGRVLSVYFEGLETHTLHAQVNEAHPAKLLGAVTLDTRTGQLYALRDLFRHRGGFRTKLDSLIAARLAKDKELAQAMGSDPAAYQTDVQQHHYSFYLTPRSLVIFNIFGNFALGSVAVSLPTKALAGIADPAGPLRAMR